MTKMTLLERLLWSATLLVMTSFLTTTRTSAQDRSVTEPATAAPYAPDFNGPLFPESEPTPDISQLNAPTRSVPPEMEDPAFDRYVDLDLLGRAWDGKDAALLTDVACQLAEGERILLRAHRAFTADAVFEKAAQLAAEKKDKATLDRLAKIAEKHAKAALKAQFGAAAKLAATTRAADPALMVPVEQTTPKAFAAYQSLLADVQSARLSRDRAVLDELETAVKNMEGVAKNQRDALLRLIAETREAIPKDAKPDATALALAKLSAESRANWWERAIRPQDLFPRPQPSYSHLSDDSQPYVDEQPRVFNVQIVNPTNATIVVYDSPRGRFDFPPGRQVTFTGQGPGAKLTFGTGSATRGRQFWRNVVPSGDWEFVWNGDGFGLQRMRRRVTVRGL
jgi:hypothetical protein